MTKRLQAILSLRVQLAIRQSLLIQVYLDTNKRHIIIWANGWFDYTPPAICVIRPQWHKVKYHNGNSILLSMISSITCHPQYGFVQINDTKIRASIMGTTGPFYLHGLILIPTLISNYTHYKVWDEFTYPFPNFNGSTVEVWLWRSNFIPHLTGYVITYLCMY